MHDDGKPSKPSLRRNGGLLHRRSSSRWIPQNAPIFERALDMTTTTFSLKNRLFRNKKEGIQDRLIEPNWMQSDMPRYRLPNYKQFTNNKISTSKYTWWNFVPKNLWEQFQRWANIYFCIIVGMNWIPALNAFSKYLGMIPVIVILSMTAVKDFIEDWRRKRADYRLNHNTVHVWDATKKRFRKTLWELVLVGDLIHVSLDDKLPADIVLIRSSDPEGCVFVETANLDGENNLKQKVAVTKCKQFCFSDTFDPTSLYLKIMCNPPDNRLNHIAGTVVYGTGETDRISKENVILRGCQIRNTAFAEGIVIYTGKETKLMLSNGSIKYKRSSLEQITNYFILFCVLLLIFMVVSGGICSMIWLREYDAHNRNIPFVVLYTDSALRDGLINMAAFILVYQTLIPLSLYISIEMVKLGQNYLMSHDLDMYDHERDKNMMCRSLNIPEELGQIKYVLSDKTGTLTENKMIFRSCAIDAEIFEATPTNTEYKHRRSTLKTQQAVPPTTLCLPQIAPQITPSNGHLHHSQSAPSFPQLARQQSNAPLVDDKPIICPRLHRELQAETAQAGRSHRFYFLLNMCVCNTVMVRQPQKVDDVEMGYVEDNVYNVGNSAFFVPADSSQTATSVATPKTAELTPNGHSFTRQFTFSTPDFLKRIGSLSSLSKIFQRRPTIGGKAPTTSDPAALFDAESPDELALVKAADAYGFTLVSRSNTDIRVRLPTTSSPLTPSQPTIYEDEIELEVLKVLPFDSNRKRMSIVVKMDEELILLCKGADEQIIPNLDPSQNDAQIVDKTRRILENYGRVGLRTLCMAMRRLDAHEFSEWMETREFVESVTDESDELVSESSKQLEIKLQLLGVSAIEDKLQDGVTECIDDLRMAGIQIWVLTGDKLETAINIAKSCHLFNSHLQIIEFHTLEDVKQHSASQTLLNAVFSSEIIRLMKEGEPEVFKLIPSCAAIVCYRMTPAEKAEVVKAVKTRLKGKALAIGDGANDVPMILSADVGVGISGREGLQAVMASDFAISRFRFLRKMLLVHGHWNYYRLANVILYFLEKNAIFVLVIYWEQLFNGFSSGFLIDPLYSMLYPIIFTSVQPIVYSVFDQDVKQSLLLKYPHLYEQGRESQLCTTKSFALSMLDAFWQSAALFFIPYLAFEESALTFWQLGFVISTGMFFANSLHLAMMVRRWTTPLVIIFALFALVHFLFFTIYTTIGSSYFGTKDPPLQVAFSMMKMAQFWTCSFLSMTIALLPRLMIRLLSNRFWPDLCQKTIIEERRH